LKKGRYFLYQTLELNSSEQLPLCYKRWRKHPKGKRMLYIYSIKGKFPRTVAIQETFLVNRVHQKHRYFKHDGFKINRKCVHQQKNMLKSKLAIWLHELSNKHQNSYYYSDWSNQWGMWSCVFLRLPQKRYIWV